MNISDAKLEIAQASRILYGLGVLDGFGHVSRRYPGRPDRYLMNRRMAPGLVTPADVFEHDLDSNGIDADNSILFLERFIHGEIYRARSDVVSVVHSHSPSVLPFTVVPDVRLRPLSHVCGFIEGTGPAFDIAEHEGHCTDLLIRSPSLGRAFAAHLGDKSIALMRSHGFTAVGDSVRQAVYRAVYTGVNSNLQLAAVSLGEPRYMTSEEAAACDRTTNMQINRVWDQWRERFPYDPA